MMKLCVSLIFVLAATSAWATDGKGDHKAGEHFQKNKQEMTQVMDQRISNMQAAKACVANASDHEGMKRCHAESKEKRLEMRKQHLELRKAKLEQKTTHP